MHIPHTRLSLSVGIFSDNLWLLHGTACTGVSRALDTCHRGDGLRCDGGTYAWVEVAIRIDTLWQCSRQAAVRCCNVRTPVARAAEGRHCHRGFSGTVKIRQVSCGHASRDNSESCGADCQDMCPVSNTSARLGVQLWTGMQDSAWPSREGGVIICVAIA